MLRRVKLQAAQTAALINRTHFFAVEEAKQLRQIPPSSKTHLLVHSTTVAEDNDSLPIKNKCENVIKGNNLRNYGLNN